MELELIRPKQYQDRIRDYQILIDGIEVTTIEPGGTKLITVPDDAELIQAKIDWCYSPKIKLEEVKSGKLIVKNNIGGSFLASLFLPLYYITFGREKYLTIEVAP